MVTALMPKTAPGTQGRGGLVERGEIVKVTVCLTRGQLRAVDLLAKRRGLSRGAAVRSVLDYWQQQPAPMSP